MQPPHRLSGTDLYTRDPSSPDFVFPDPANTLHPYQMGQGASTPHDGREASGVRRSGTQQHAAAGASQNSMTQSTVGDSRNPGSSDDATTTAVLRRSRRLRNHIEHISRLGGRMISSSTQSSPNPSPASNRLQNRFRSRAARFSISRSPSPPSAIGRPSPASPRSRLRNSHIPESDADMMDVSPVVTTNAIPQTSSFTTPSEVPIAAESRPSRLARVRSSLSSWPSIIPEIRGSSTSRPASRRLSLPPSRSRRASIFGSRLGDHGHGADGDTDMPFAPDIGTTSQLGAPSQSGLPQPQRERPASDIMDELDNPARVRPGEDQAAMLSRLLSVAAAATAASLVGGTEQAITEAQDVAGDNGGDGSFESFLRALQNGRLAAALRNGGNELGGGPPPDSERSESVMPPLNFFRMFRFGSTPNPSADAGGDSTEGGRSRMVPVIIVGIRSVNPRETPDAEGNRPGPFFDALANLPLSIPSIQRRSRLSNSHRRASVGGAPSSTFGFDNQRHSRGASTGSLRPEMDSTPSPVPPIPQVPIESPRSPPADPTTFGSRREESRVPVDSTSVPGIDNGVGPSSSREASRRRLSRRLSGPDVLPPLGRAGVPNAVGSAGSGGTIGGNRRSAGGPEGTRSWIIYVLGGSYPEDHPILTTPSLFTDVSFNPLRGRTT